VAGIVALLTPDATLRMRPLPVEYRGRSAARYFLAVVAFPGGTPSYRLIATRANGQPAFGCYLRDPAVGIDHACGLVVLTVDGGHIAAIDRFVDNSMLPRFGLPRTLPEDRLPAGYARPSGSPAQATARSTPPSRHVTGLMGPTRAPSGVHILARCLSTSPSGGVRGRPGKFGSA
jgi:hypothetical protein